MKCSIDICDREAKKRNLCLAHYERFIRNGEDFDRSPIVDVKCMKSKFTSKIGMPNDNGCMEWLGWKNKHGYGKFSVGSKYAFAHRYSYEFHIGAIPVGLFVCHSCDNRGCVAPQHLWLGTNIENQQDMRNKGRQNHHRGPLPNIQGLKHINAKLTEDKVKDIKIKLLKGIKGTIIARKYNVSDQTIYDIKNGKNWKHVNI